MAGYLGRFAVAVAVAVAAAAAVAAAVALRPLTAFLSVPLAGSLGRLLGRWEVQRHCRPRGTLARGCHTNGVARVQKDWRSFGRLEIGDRYKPVT